MKTSSTHRPCTNDRPNRPNQPTGSLDRAGNTPPGPISGPVAGPVACATSPGTGPENPVPKHQKDAAGPVGPVGPVLQSRGRVPSRPEKIGAATENTTKCASSSVPDLDRPQLVTADAAADMLSVSPRTLFSLTKKGEIPALNIGRALRYDIADVWAFIASAKAAKR